MKRGFIILSAVTTTVGFGAGYAVSEALGLGSSVEMGILTAGKFTTQVFGALAFIEWCGRDKPRGKKMRAPKPAQIDFPFGLFPQPSARAY